MTSDNVIVVSVGKLSLSNSMKVVEGVREDSILPPVAIEEYHTQLESIELCRFEFCFL